MSSHFKILLFCCSLFLFCAVMCVQESRAASQQQQKFRGSERKIVSCDEQLRSNEIKFQWLHLSSCLMDNQALGNEVSAWQVTRELLIALAALFTPAAASEEEGAERLPLPCQRYPSRSSGSSMYGSMDVTTRQARPVTVQPLKGDDISVAPQAVGNFKGYQVIRVLDPSQQEENSPLLSKEEKQKHIVLRETLPFKERVSFVFQTFFGEAEKKQQSLPVIENVTLSVDLAMCDKEVEQALKSVTQSALAAKSAEALLTSQELNEPEKMEWTQKLNAAKNSETFWTAKAFYWEMRKQACAAIASLETATPAAEKSVTAILMGADADKLHEAHITALDEVKKETIKIAQAYTKVVETIRKGEQEAPDSFKKEWSSFLESVEQEKVYWEVESLSSEVSIRELQARHSLDHAYHLPKEEIRVLWIWNKAITDVEGVISACEKALESYAAAFNNTPERLKQGWVDAIEKAHQKKTDWTTELLEAKARRAEVVVAAALGKHQEALKNARSAHGNAAILAWDEVIKTAWELKKVLLEAREVYQVGADNAVGSLKSRWEEHLTRIGKEGNLLGPKIHRWREIQAELKKPYFKEEASSSS